MAEALFRHTAAGLMPLDDAASEALSKVPLGHVLRMKWARVRNPRHHALYWALVTLVYNNLPEAQAKRYPSVEAFVSALKVLTGHAEWFWLPDGTRVVRPKSIAFHAMGQDAFNDFFNRCCDLIVKHWLPGVAAGDLRAEAESMLGLTRRAA